MDEEETNEKPTEPTQNDDEGSKPKTNSIIERASKENERMEKIMEEMKAENDRREEIISREILGGRSEAGQGVLVKPKETDEEYAERVQKGEANPLLDDA